MSTSSTFPCSDDTSHVRERSFHITQDNPIRILELNQNTSGRVIRSLDEGQLGATKRMFGGRFLTQAFTITHGVNSQVMTEHFKKNFEKIFRNRTTPVIKGTVTQVGRKHGTLETYWPAKNIALTRHHIIPKSRGGINDDANYFLIPRNVHDDLHEVFGVMTPIEQLAFLTLAFKESYHPKFIDEMCDLILSRSQNYNYNRRLLNNGKVEY